LVISHTSRISDVTNDRNPPDLAPLQQTARNGPNAVAERPQHSVLIEYMELKTHNIVSQITEKTCRQPNG